MPPKKMKKNNTQSALNYFMQRKDLWMRRALIFRTVLAHFGFSVDAVLEAEADELRKLVFEDAETIIDHFKMGENNVAEKPKT